MATAFGPQGPNFTTVRPAADPKVSAADTFFKNCSQPGAKDGTFATADFFNVIIANLRGLVRNAGVTLDDANDNMVSQAVTTLVQQAISASLVTYTASQGLKKVGTDIRSTLGDGSRTRLVP